MTQSLEQNFKLYHDIDLLVGMRQARQEFVVDLFEVATDKEKLLALYDKSGNIVFAIFEFFYAARALENTDAIATIAESHNQYVKTLLSTRYAGQSGRMADRLRNSIFGKGSLRQLSKINQLSGEIPRTVIRKLMAEVTSTTTIDLMLNAMEEVGLLESREEEKHRQIMYRSTGKIEAAFSGYLEKVRKAAVESA